MRFLVAILVSFLTGVIFTDFVSEPIIFSLWSMLLALGIGVIWRRASVAGSTPLLLGIFFLGLSLGLLRAEVFSWQFGNSELANLVDKEVVVEGVIKREPIQGAKTVQLYVDNGDDLVLVTADRNYDVSYGDKVVVTGQLSRPENFTTDLGREFDYQQYLQVRGVEYRISFAELEVTETGSGNRIVSMLLSAKHFFMDSVKRILPEPEVSLGNGLLLGVKSALGDEIEENFRRTGIIHIVVLSGYNVMLVVAFIMFGLSIFLPLKGRMIFGILAIVAFALIVGLSATVVRASLMAGLVLIATAYGRTYDVMRALLMAGFFMLLVNPYLVYDIGFQLSFMATLGLLLVLPHFETKLLEQKDFLNLRDFFLATVSTQIAVLPLLLYHIGEVSLIAVVVNILVLPIVPAAMLLTFLTGVSGFVSIALAKLFGSLATLTLAYILLMADWFAGLPFATITVPEFGEVGLFSLYGVIGLVLYYLNHRNNTTDNSLAGWVIEEEEKVAGELRSPATPKDVPVFFR